MSFTKKPKAINPDEVDASVYYYDEVYDQMKDEEKKEKTRQREEYSKTTGSQSKYIQGIKETAELRKTEKELRKFKKYTRDREEAEANGDLSDNDVYVTDSYKKKLEEIKALEEKKRKQLAQEDNRSMNFLKSHDIHQPGEIKINKDKSKQTMVDRRTDSVRTKDSPLNQEVDSSIDITNQITDIELPIKKKRLKTAHDRRRYLREVLAKRTVGDKFREAVRRYKERVRVSSENKKP